MLSKKTRRICGLRKLVSLVISLSMLTTILPIQSVQAQEYGERGSISAIKEMAEKYQQDLLNLELEVGVEPIQEDVNILSEEEQAIIVEFKALPKVMFNALNDGASTYKLKSSEVEQEHEAFNKFLVSQGKEKSTSSYVIEHAFYDTFNGVTMKVKGTDIPKLLESGVVKSIWKDETVTVEPDINYEESSNEISGRMVTSKPLIGVDQLREEGITGKGVKVGVLDTGIDYNHPDLKDSYRPGGYDFVNNDDDPMETTYDDWKASGEAESNGTGNTYYTFHGTHVSGTIAANGKNAESEYAVTGVAPEAELYGYKVLGPYGTGFSSDIMAAIEKSVEDGMDVINMSLGTITPNPLYPSSVACNNASIAGVVTVVSNGNAGPEISSVGAPATSALAISVGASTTNISIDKFIVTTSSGVALNGNLMAKPFAGVESILSEEHDIIYGGYGSQEELKGLDVKGKILFIDRGNLSFADKFKYAREAGAIGVIIANNVSGSINLYFGESVNMIPVISMSMEEGQKLKAAIKAETIKVNVALNGKTTTEPDKLADFSSRGPSMDETIKPDITAPGVGIFSTYPEYINSPQDGIDYTTAYARIDGTSMAAPHIAGVAALILQEHKDYTPEDVKVAMMNTAEELAETYGVNEMGAGRINAYEAVHSDVAIKVLDKCASLDEDDNKIQIDYITGSMSFDRIAKKDVDSTKKLDLEISNSGNVDKEFSIAVEFLNKESMGTKNAADNGVYLSIAESAKVKVGEKVSLEAAITVPADAEIGRYEGFVIFTNVEDATEDYRIPFSVIYLTPGVEYVELSRPAMSNDLDMMHFAKIPGITGTLKVSSPISRIDLYIKDYETQKTIGYLGSTDASELPPGYDARLMILSGRGNYFPVKEDGTVEYVLRNLTDGKYTVEIVAIDAETSEKYTLNKDILIDNEDAKMTFDREGGVYEITEDMFTTEEFAGQEYSAFWVKGNVTDNSIAELNEMGYNVDASSIQMPAFVSGYPRMSLPVDKNGDFKFGIEMSDVEFGVYEFAPMPVDIATAQNMFLQPRYFFVKEGAPYYSTNLNKDEIVEGENITATIGIHNVTGSSFETALEYFRPFEIMDIRVSEQLQKIVDENNYKVNISKNITGDTNKSLSLKLEVFDQEGNPVDISGTISLIDVELKLVSDADSEFYREYIQCNWMEVLDKEENYVDISSGGTYEGVDIKQQTSAVRVPQLAEGFYECLQLGKYTTALDKYIWLEDASGKKYDLEYLKSTGEYYVMNLPASEEEMTVTTSMPGHFKKVGKFVPSRILDGEVVGKVYYMLGEEFFRIISGGETNDDGVIDIYDALAVEKYYGQNITLEENEKLQVDFNFDGIVNAYDMDYIVDNYTDYNEQISVDKDPVLNVEGRDLDDVLEATGYNSEVRLEGMQISKTSLSLEIGQSEQLTATLKPANVENIGLKWYSDNEKIATVDKEGNVTAVSPGTTRIRVSTSDSRITLSCKVNVCINGKVPSIKEVTIEEPVRDVYVGDEFDLNFNVAPYNTLPTSVEYISSANSIVSVKDGKAVANKPGKAFVTIDINYGRFIETWEINVKPISVKSIELNKNKIELDKGQSEQLEVTINPENATNKNVIWTSSDEKIATVVDGKIVAVGKGEAVITVTSEDGGLTDSCKVTVTDKASEIVHVKSIKLNKNKLELEKGKSEQLKVTINPENATNKNVTWTSSDEKIATVVDGKIVAVGKGEAVITITSEDGGFTDTCKVIVTEKDTSNPENPNKPNKPNKPNLPQTGAVAGASVAMVVGVIAVGVGLFLKKKKS